MTKRFVACKREQGRITKERKKGENGSNRDFPMPFQGKTLAQIEFYLYLCKTEQNKTEQNKTEDNKTKLNKIEDKQ